jgi:hypothetical protein
METEEERRDRIAGIEAEIAHQKTETERLERLVAIQYQRLSELAAMLDRAKADR